LYFAFLICIQKNSFAGTLCFIQIALYDKDNLCLCICWKKPNAIHILKFLRLKHAQNKLAC